MTEMPDDRDTGATDEREALLHPEIPEALTHIDDLLHQHADDVDRIAQRLAALPAEERLEALKTDEQWKSLIGLLVIDVIQDLAGTEAHNESALTAAEIANTLVERIATSLRSVFATPQRLPSIPEIFPD